MAILTLDDYISSKKQLQVFFKSATTTTVAAAPFSVFDLAGQPGAGTLAAGNTTSGIVPTSSTTGYPTINTFDSGATGYLSRVEFSSTVACRLTLYDRLFVAGAFAFNANTTLSSQPSFASRVPNSNYNGLELWIETVTAFTGTPSFQIGYLNQNGSSKNTGVVSAGSALTLRRCFQMPLASGDTGIQRIDSVACTVATAGTFNVMILRPLWTGRVVIANSGDIHDLLRTGLIQVFQDSALYLLVTADSTSSGLPYIHFEIANK
jgi:hypothetical protein